MSSVVDPTITTSMKDDMYKTISQTFAQKMTEAVMQKEILTSVGNLSGELIKKVAGAFNVDPEKIAGAFKFDLSEDELKRIMTAMTNASKSTNAKSNLILMGYQDYDEPTSISFYLKILILKKTSLVLLMNIMT